MKIHIYGEHTLRAGKICTDERLIESDSDDICCIDGDVEYIRGIANSYKNLSFNAKNRYIIEVGKNLLRYIDSL